MSIACHYGHLSVCKWLFEVGAAADITKTNNDGDGETPMFIASQGGGAPVGVHIAVRGGCDRGHQQGELHRRHARAHPSPARVAPAPFSLLQVAPGGADNSQCPPLPVGHTKHPGRIRPPQSGALLGNTPQIDAETKGRCDSSSCMCRYV